MQRTSNSIRSLHSIASQASLYSPLVSSLSSLPETISIDKSSYWQTSALQATAMETISLPGRLRSTAPGHCLLSDIEQLFTAIASNRKIVQTEVSVRKPDAQVNGATANGDHLEASHDARLRDSHFATDEDSQRMDISLFPRLVSTNVVSLRPHLFSRLIVHRGSSDESLDAAPQQRDPYAPTVLRLSNALAFPTSLTSFPHIFREGNGGTVMDQDITVHASMSSTATVATWLRGMADLSRRLLPMDEREDVHSGLKAWADDYIGGWDSADEDDGDSD